MIYLILKTYFLIFLMIGLTSFFLFLTGMLFIYRNWASDHRNKFQQNKSKKSISSHLTITVSDIQSIAGEDTFATQLDLARAYLETDRKKLAKKILEHVIRKGNFAQQTEARNLLSLI